ncbi:MAG: DUF5672 family protein [Bacteroidota bacterium]
MNTDAVIIIPIYKQRLSLLEDLSIKQCFNVLSNYKIIAIKPDHLTLENYTYNFDDVISFSDEYFADPAGYNALMRSASFYDQFLTFEYMLIYQPDAFVFKDELNYWCKEGYDYIGAPWVRHADYPDIVKKTKMQFLQYMNIRFNLKQPGTDLPTEIQLENKVGNGGLSLRKVDKFLKVCHDKKTLIDYYNSRPEHYFGEDVFWGIEVNRFKKLINIPNYKIALHFSMESNLQYSFSLTNGELPFGCHAWDRNLDFWRPVFKSLGHII